MEQIVNRGGRHPLKSHANINVYLRTSSRFENSGNTKESGKWESIKNKTVCASTRCVITSMHGGGGSKHGKFLSIHMSKP